MSKYRYYIEGTEVFPQGEWSISYQRNEGQIFFRRIFDGELTFIGADYDLIKSFCCRIITFDIYCGGAIHWQGQFQYPYLVGFDDDSCIAIITPEVVDEYSCIMDNYENGYYVNPSVGGVAPGLWTCAGVMQIAALPTIYPIAVTGAAGTGGYFNYMLNGTFGIGCSINIESSFFCRSDFANGDNYAAAHGTDNYITGATNRLEYIYIGKNTSLRQHASWAVPACDNPNAHMTFKDLETFIRNAFNAYWFIDENGDFRIEHIYYFDPAFANSDYTVGQDLTTVMDRGGRSFAYRRNKYEYETGRMYDQELWSWQHYEGTEGTVGHGTDFEGVPVFYGAAAVSYTHLTLPTTPYV